MPIEKVYAQLSCSDLENSVVWFEHLEPAESHLVVHLRYGLPCNARSPGGRNRTPSFMGTRPDK